MEPEDFAYDWKEIARENGWESSEEDSDFATKCELDEYYEKGKPAPYVMDPTRYRIIDVKATKNQRYKNNKKASKERTAEARKETAEPKNVKDAKGNCREETESNIVEGCSSWTEVVKKGRRRGKEISRDAEKAGEKK